VSSCGGGTEQQTSFAPETGVLRVLETNPRWLTDDSGKAKYFTGPTGQFTVNPNATVSTVQDFWNEDVSGVNDYATAFDTVVANGHNFVRLWRWETSVWGSRAQFASNTYWRVPILQMPWSLVSTRVDSSTGINITVGVYDLATFNQSYFDRLRAVVLSAVNKGLTPSVMLFEGSANGALTEFSGFSHPMFGVNNVNGVSCDTNSNVHCDETHTLTNATITAYQDAYVQKVIDTLNDIDGYVYEIVNETGFDTVPWQNHVADTVSNYEQQEGRQSHPVWMSHLGNGNGQIPSNDYLFHNGYVQIIGPAGREYETAPPHNHGNKRVNVVFHDTDHGGMNGNGIVNSEWPWKSLTRGISPLLLDCPFEICKREPDSERPSIRRAMAQTLAYASKINLKAMTVETGRSIIDSGYGLYESCVEYLMYMPEDGSHGINLSSCQPDHAFAVEFFEPLTGITTSGETVTGGAVRSFNPPGPNPMVVHLKAIPR
jgi:hypothetical protein